MEMKRHCVQLRDPPSMPSLCAGMPPITTQYAPNIKRRNILKSVTHRAYGPAVCPVCPLTEEKTGSMDERALARASARLMRLQIQIVGRNGPEVQSGSG
eukprot:COSAG06_NODE_2167_length_7426_cov_7.331787_10_plen_99_part_00